MPAEAPVDIKVAGEREDWTRDSGDTDRTDFRGAQASYGHREAGCVYCALEGSGRVLLENELALCIADAYPVSEGHRLVIPRRHGAEGLELHQPEWNAVVECCLPRTPRSAAGLVCSTQEGGLTQARQRGRRCFMRTGI